MDIRERYNIEETSDSLSIHPYKPAVQVAWWFIAGIIPTAIVLFFIRRLVGEVIFASLYIIMAYGIVHSLYEIFIKAGINYRFSVAANAVYQRTLFRQQRKIMRLDELVIFTSSEMGSWRYSIGARKSHLVKNYTISENFSGGRKSEERLEVYEREILDKIGGMLDAVKKQNVQ